MHPGIVNCAQCVPAAVEVLTCKIVGAISSPLVLQDKGRLTCFLQALSDHKPHRRRSRTNDFRAAFPRPKFRPGNVTSGHDGDPAATTELAPARHQPITGRSGRDPDGLFNHDGLADRRGLCAATAPGYGPS